MTAAQVLDLKGKKVRELKLSEEIFAIDATRNSGLMHTALVRQLANARTGSANTKTRSEVRGGGRKPWRQKGTGRARAGSTRSPLWAGGGVTFGPKPRDYSISMPRKMRMLAIASALAAKRDDLVVVADLNDFSTAKTKAALQVFKDLKMDGKKVLVVLDHAGEASSRFALAARNLAQVTVIHASNLNVKDLLNCDLIFTDENTLNGLSKRFAAVGKGQAHREGAKAKSRTKASGATTKAAEPKAKSEKTEQKEEAERPTSFNIASVSKPTKAAKAPEKTEAPKQEKKPIKFAGDDLHLDKPKKPKKPE